MIKRGRGEEFNGTHFSYSNPRRNMQRWRGERRKKTFVPFIHIWERRSEPSRERERENFLRGRIFPKTGSFQADPVKRQGSSSGKTKRLAFSHVSPRGKRRRRGEKIAERENGCVLRQLLFFLSFPLCSSSFRSFLMKNRPFEKRGWKKNAATAVEEEDRGWQAGGVRYQCIQEKEFPLKTGENAEKRWNQRAEEEGTPRGLRIERG